MNGRERAELLVARFIGQLEPSPSERTEQAISDLIVEIDGSGVLSGDASDKMRTGRECLRRYFGSNRGGDRQEFIGQARDAFGAVRRSLLEGDMVTGD